MKKTLLIIVGILTTVSLYSQDEVVSANNNFAYKIYNTVKPEFGSCFISPLSISFAMAMLNEGAGTTTKQEIDKLLCIENIQNQSDQFHQLIEITNDTTELIKAGNKISISNSLWLSNKYEAKKDYIDAIDQKFDAELFYFDGNEQAKTNEQITKWVKDKTNNKIKETEGIDPDTFLKLYNATCFYGKWQYPFNSSQTAKSNFYSKVKGQSKIDFMNQKSDISYYENRSLKAILIPYKYNQFTMLIILPKRKFGLYKIEKKLDWEHVRKILNSMKEKSVVLSLPKFKHESKFGLKKSLENLGCEEIFNSKADLSKMGGNVPFRLDEIIHRAFIDLDEEGTEAAALTEMTVVGLGINKKPPKPKEFLADHPFQFYIIDNRTKAIAFMGRFANE